MIVLRAERSFDGEFAADSIKAIARRFPGPHDLTVRVGNSNLLLGPQWRIEESRECLAALGEFGDVDIKLDEPRAA